MNNELLSTLDENCQQLLEECSNHVQIDFEPWGNPYYGFQIRERDQYNNPKKCTIFYCGEQLQSPTVFHQLLRLKCACRLANGEFIISKMADTPIMKAIFDNFMRGMFVCLVEDYLIYDSYRTSNYSPLDFYGQIDIDFDEFYRFLFKASKIKEESYIFYVKNSIMAFSHLIFFPLGEIFESELNMCREIDPDLYDILEELRNKINHTSIDSIDLLMSQDIYQEVMRKLEIYVKTGLKGSEEDAIIKYLLYQPLINQRKQVDSIQTISHKEIDDKLTKTYDNELAHIKKANDLSIRHFAGNYDVVFKYICDDASKKCYLGNKDQRECRFCGKNEKEVSFKKEAHAISRFLGNNRLFSYYECDVCNENIFGKMESNLSEYLKLFHLICGVNGRSGVPSYKPSSKGLSRIDRVDNNIHIKYFEEEPPIVELNLDEKRIIVKGHRTFVPQLVYKALLKMALTIAPEEELPSLKGAFEFLMGELVDDIHIPVGWQMYFNGYNVFNFITVSLFKRKSTSVWLDAPQYIFLLAYNNFCFQVPVYDPRNKDVQIKLPILPTPPLLYGYPYRQLILDMGSINKLNQDFGIPLQFESITESVMEK